jgi:molybdopterin molybdotransferase
MMLEYDAALQQAIYLGRELGSGQTETVSVGAAYGRVLRDEIHAAWPVPARDYSAMDGYAVSCADFRGATFPHLLPLRGESRPGATPMGLVSGTTQRIFTGGTIPPGVDAIVIQENVTVTAGGVQFDAAPRQGDHIRRAGEDLERGALALARGTRISAAVQSLLATLERSEVQVSVRPRVTILCTGDELRDPVGVPSRALGTGENLSLHEPPRGLAESNSLALKAMCERRGAQVLAINRARDDRMLLGAALERAMSESDVLVTVGGASVGDHDLVKPLLKELGAEVIVPKVAIKPGKPVFLARRDGTVILGLPGNPSSALVTFCLFGWPLLGAWLGDAEVQLPEVKAPFLGTYRQKPGRRSFLRGAWSAGGVQILGNQASGAGTTIAAANVLVHLEPEVESLIDGAMVRVIPLWGL